MGRLENGLLSAGKYNNISTCSIFMSPLAREPILLPAKGQADGEEWFRGNSKTHPQIKKGYSM
jgi:hypothetical protein